MQRSFVQGGGGPRHSLSHMYGEAVPFQRFVLVLSGSVELSSPGSSTKTLGANHYAFFPSNSEYRLIASAEGAGLLVYERLVEDLQMPDQEILHGEVEKMPLLDTGVCSRSSAFHSNIDAHTSAPNVTAIHCVFVNLKAENNKAKACP